MSIAVAVPKGIIVVGPVASTTMFGGGVTFGAVVSATVIVKDAESRLPDASVAVTVTVVAPSGKVDPASWL